jgi:hypothetical protein
MGNLAGARCDEAARAGAVPPAFMIAEKQGLGNREQGIEKLEIGDQKPKSEGARD